MKEFVDTKNAQIPDIVFQEDGQSFILWDDQLPTVPITNIHTSVPIDVVDDAVYEYAKALVRKQECTCSGFQLLHGECNCGFKNA